MQNTLTDLMNCYLPTIKLSIYIIPGLGAGGGVELLIQEFPKNANKKFHFVRYRFAQVKFKKKIRVAIPNVESILRLFLSLKVTNCTGERSFSRLKNIKNELRTTTTQMKFSALSLLCIENETFDREDLRKEKKSVVQKMRSNSYLSYYFFMF